MEAIHHSLSMMFTMIRSLTHDSVPTIAARMPSNMTNIESINQQDCPFIPVYLSILALSGKAKLRHWSV